MLIDDDPACRCAVGTSLRRLGHRVEEAASGAVGLALLSQRPVDLVLTDLRMPGLTGGEVARLAKGLHPGLPVVLVTGSAAILAFIFSWNQFLFPLVLSGPNTQTVPVAVFNFITHGEINYGGLAAAAVLITLPVVILALFIQPWIVQGLTMGAVKG